MSIILNNTYNPKSTYTSLEYCSYVDTKPLLVYHTQIWFITMGQFLECVLSHVWLFTTLWTISHQAPLSVGFPRQEYWSGFLLQGIFLTQKSKLYLLHLLHWQVDSLPLCHLGSPSISRSLPWYMDHISLKCVSSNLQSEELTTYSRDLPIFNAQYHVGG